VPTVPLTEAKAKLNELVEDAVAMHERVTITRHGRPAAILLSIDDFESLQETLFWQSQAGITDDLDRSEREAREGQLYDEAQVRAKLGLPPKA
jgi:antitoxin YefM